MSLEKPTSPAPPSPSMSNQDSFAMPETGIGSGDAGDGAALAGGPAVGALADGRGLSLRKNFVWTVVGNVTYAACQWGMLMALAKLGSPEMVGQFALGLAIGAPVMLLANLQLRAVIATDVRSDYLFGEYLGLRLASTSIAFAVISAIAILGGYRSETAWVVVLVGLAKSVESVSDIIYGVFQKYERLDRIGVALILRGVGSVVLFALAIRITGQVKWAAGALVAWWCAVLVAYEWRTGGAMLKAFGQSGEKFAPSWAWPRLRPLAWLCLPLGLVMVMVSLSTNIPRFFVQHHLGEAALGYFAALAYVMVAGFTVMNALGQSASPRLARYYQSDRAAFRRLLAKMLLVAAAVGAAGILVAVLWGGPLLTLLYRADYAGHAGVFVWVMIAAAVSYFLSVFGYALTGQRVLRPQVILAGMMVLVVILACFYCVPAFGLRGAALALVASNLVGTLIGAFLVSRADSAPAGGKA